VTNSRAILSLPIASIAIGPRIGFFHAAHSARIGESMAEEGQHDPIHVQRNGDGAKLPWTLIAGLHRLRGAIGNGWSEIAAIEVADASANDADLRRLELSENVDHLQRRPIERAIMMAEYARLEEAVDHPGKIGETKQSRGGRMKAAASVTMTEAADWRTRTARAFTVSLSTLERHQRLYRDIYEALPDLAQALNDHPLGESLNQMIELAKVPEDYRGKVAQIIIDDPEIESVTEAKVKADIRLSNGNRHDPKKSQARWKSDWIAMTSEEKRANFLDIAKNIPPAYVRQAIDILSKLLPRAGSTGAHNA
jgi:ParB family transcriptional regulator, chromosome partitioning protein